jgi:YspA, cpYpsA-related SLOG family
MKLIIAGSREWTDQNTVFTVLDMFSTGHKVTEVVIGGARGPDTFGETWAEARMIPVKKFIPNWQQHGKKAGVLRNADMAHYAAPGGALVAFWDGKSPGTRDMINKAKAAKLLVWVVTARGIKTYAPQGELFG